MSPEGHTQRASDSQPRHTERSLSKAVSALLFAVIGQDVAGRAKAVMWSAMTVGSLSPELSRDANEIAESASKIESHATGTLTVLAEVLENPLSEDEVYETIASLVNYDMDLETEEEKLLALLKKAARISNAPLPQIRILRRTSLGKLVDALTRAGFQYNLRRP